MGLWESIRDVFFPVKLPPLELTSTPIPVPDRMAVKANPWAIGISSTRQYCRILSAVLLVGIGRSWKYGQAEPTQATNIESATTTRPKPPTKAGGGGGGGDRSIVEANKGKLPEQGKDADNSSAAADDRASQAARACRPSTCRRTFNCPTTQYADDRHDQFGRMCSWPRRAREAAREWDRAAAAAWVRATATATGRDSGGNTGGGLYQIGGGVSAPIVLHSVEAEFSDEARRAKYQGVCLVSLIVDAQGNPQNIHVARALGMGLDEKAIEAIRQYKFKPAMKDGKTPVPVMITIEVDFRLY